MEGGASDGGDCALSSNPAPPRGIRKLRANAAGCVLDTISGNATQDVICDNDNDNDNNNSNEGAATVVVNDALDTAVIQSAMTLDRKDHERNNAVMVD